MTREPFRPGDPVTIILPDHVVMATVHTSAPTWFMVTLSSRGAKTYESKWQLSEEGIDWLSGYYVADSPEVAACRTAQALGPKSTPAPIPAQNPSFLGTDISSGGGGASIDRDFVRNMLRGILSEQEDK